MSFENEYDRTSYSKYYTPSIEIKDFNVLIDGKQIELENPDLKKQIILLVNLKMIEQQCFVSLKNQEKQLLIFQKIL